jgi:hypothetical protein
MTEKVINEEEITVSQPWRGAMKRQVHNIIISTLEASETMLEELDPDSDPKEQYISFGNSLRSSHAASPSPADIRHVSQVVASVADAGIDRALGVKPEVKDNNRFVAKLAQCRIEPRRRRISDFYGIVPTEAGV